MIVMYYAGKNRGFRLWLALWRRMLENQETVLIRRWIH